MSIEKLLKIKFPIYWGDWPIEKESAIYLIYSLISKRPNNIVELGSGNSTLIIVKTMESLGYSYHLTSIDSDKDFLERTKNLLISEGVYNENNIKLIYAPIEKIEINQKYFFWYNRESFSNLFSEIDYLFIDGPVGGFCKNARFPALNILSDFLKKDGCNVLMHDYSREDEKEIVKEWCRENFNIFNLKEINTPRGIVDFDIYGKE